MKSSLPDLHLYCRVVETGSLRAAALEIGTDPSNVSRRVASLEARLGVRLLERSRVRTIPTDTGQKYYEDLKPLLEQFQEVEDRIVGGAEEPRGVLRVAAPIDFGARYIGPWLYELASQAPELAIDLRVSDAYVDFAQEGLDIAIRIGELADSALTARRLGSMPLVIVAAPSYIAAHGTPASPDELEAHAFVQYAGLQTGTDLHLTARSGEKRTVRMNARFSVNNLGGVAEIVQAGGGLHAGPHWFFAEGINAGKLIHVLTDWAPPIYPVHALYDGSAYIPAKTTRFLDLARTRMRATPGIAA